MKEKIDEYFTKNYKRLKEYFYKFCSYQEREHFDVMISNLYQHIFQNQEKLKGIIERDELQFFCVSYIYNQRNWNGTEYKNYINIKENYNDLLNEDFVILNQDVDYEEVYQKELDYNNKLNKIKIGYLNLPLHEKILYDKYFIQKQSMREIAGDIGVSHVSIHYSLQSIKKKIKNTKL
jgi:DNA-directed RNA polymerase specialized sigma subunit